MKCMKCGYENQRGSKECINCRTRFFMGMTVIETYKYSKWQKFVLFVFMLAFTIPLLYIIVPEAKVFIKGIIDHGFTMDDLIYLLFALPVLGIELFIFSIPVRFAYFALKSSDHPDSIPYEDRRNK